MRLQTQEEREGGGGGGGERRREKALSENQYLSAILRRLSSLPSSPSWNRTSMHDDTLKRYMA
jgi:hypothetical protein